MSRINIASCTFRNASRVSNTMLTDTPVCRREVIATEQAQCGRTFTDFYSLYESQCPCSTALLKPTATQLTLANNNRIDSKASKPSPCILPFPPNICLCRTTLETLPSLSFSY